MITGIYDLTGTGLYIHVPFCFSKCAYCGFYSLIPESGMLDAFLLRLEKEAADRLPEYSGNIHTIFVGGGNPMCLGLSGLKRLIEILLRHVGADSIKEWTFEANPENLTPEIISLLKGLPGIRLSVGVQRLQDQQLQVLGRRARMREVNDALSLCEKNIENFGVDFILGVPDCDSLADELGVFLNNYSIKHFSAYFLSIEPGSVLQGMIERKEFPDPDTADPEELYRVEEVLAQVGFEHYEISNYARKDFRCLHNMNYWKPGDYIGLGPAAVSCEGALRSYNPPDLMRWLGEESPACEQLSSVDRRNEYLMLRLRLLQDGLNLSSFERRFGAQEEEFYSELLWHTQQGNLEKKENVVKLSKKGIIFADRIIADLFI